MFNKDLIINILDQIIESSLIVKQRCKFAKKESDFYDTIQGQEKLDSICMKLIAIGENLKKIDKLTNHQLLYKYPQIEWKKIKGIRDFLSHHYFDLDAEIIYNICQIHIDNVINILKHIKNDLQQKENNEDIKHS